VVGVSGFVVSPSVLFSLALQEDKVPAETMRVNKSVLNGLLIVIVFIDFN
jgi:hypothetical protein